VSLLLELSLRGSVAVLLVVALDRSLAGRISGPSRRLWWCLVPLAFLVPMRLQIFPALGQLPPIAGSRSQASIDLPAGVPGAPNAGMGLATLELGIWLAGAFAYVTIVGIQTARASRQWSGERLSTDHALLGLLEDCKAEAGVTAPMGLVISNSVPSPAILGWVRPRILLPASLAASAPSAQLRPILLHELAHFRWCDVPFNWLLTLVRAVHWFNPFVHVGAEAWAHFREEAADEAAVGWMRDDTGRAYGDALVRSLRHARDTAVPFGSFAIVESVNHLKKRLTMINRYRFKSPRILLTGALSLLLASVICSLSARADDGASSDPKVAVSAAIQDWLREVDGGQYKQSWKDASTLFQSKVTADQWEGALNSVRTPLGKCTQRQQVSVAFQKDPPGPAGVTKGDFAIVQFQSSYDNLKHASETVSLFKEADGTWKAAGYFIRPD
jgi:beta-lactamase regulating signal transducer with metallopeptidase domain